MMTRSSVLLSTLLLAPTVPAMGQEPAQSGHSGRDELIVYTTLRPANHDIYLIDGPDSGPRRLTDNPALDYNATFSPDGRWLVFTSERGANADLYALDLEDGGPPVRLTRHPGIDDAADIGPDGERIAFVSTRDGNADIFVMPFSPGHPGAEEKARNLTQNRLGDFRPAFSPDGEKIAFSRHAGRASPRALVKTHLRVMNADGSDARVLYEPEGFVAADPVWSTDSRLYFHRFSMRDLASGPRWASEIWSVASDGSDARRVASDDALSLFAPVVDPNHRILFHALPPQPTRAPPPRDMDDSTVYSMASDGSDRRVEIASDRPAACQAPAVDPEGRIACHGPGPTDRLQAKSNGNPLSRPGTHRTVELPDRTVKLFGMHGYFADFLPDGRIAYAEWLPQSIQVEHWGLAPIVTSEIDGSDRQVVLDADAGLPAWATSACPEGGWIAFNAGPDFAPVDAPVDIWKVRTDGTDLTNLTDDPDANDAFPAWSSDCEQIVFRSGRDGNKEIHIMDADGSNRRRLTDHPATDTAPHISPDGKWIVFSTARGRSAPDEADDLVPVSRQGRGEGAGFRLRIQRIDGSEGRFLEPDLVGVPGRDMHPRFSPDGKWIVFVSSRGGINDEWVYTGAPQPYGEVWAIPVNGGGAVRLTHDKWENGLPRWGRGDDSETLQNAERTMNARQVAPDAAPNPRDSFACTEVVGFSQTLEWYGSFSIDELGIEQARSTVLESGHFLPRWQARVARGASVDQWSNPGFSGWQAPLRSEAVCQRETVDRVVFNVSGRARPLSEWTAEIGAAVEVVQANYPAVERIVLIPVVGAPSGKCDEVRAAGNQPVIYQAILEAVAGLGSDVVAGPAPTVHSCTHYSDTEGHLTTAGATYIHGQLKALFGG